MATAGKTRRVRTDGWIGVDLDGVLAVYPHSFPEIGPPIPRMVARVRRWLERGYDVRIFTARVAASGLTSKYGTDDAEWVESQRARIERWCETHLGQRLPVTATKDFMMITLYDDRCVQMLRNTGDSVRDRLVDLSGYVKPQLDEDEEN